MQTAIASTGLRIFAACALAFLAMAAVAGASNAAAAPETTVENQIASPALPWPPHASAGTGPRRPSRGRGPDFFQG